MTPFATLHKSGVWEKHIVKIAMKSVDKFPDAVFLDIGANIGDQHRSERIILSQVLISGMYTCTHVHMYTCIGMYTVMIAQMKRRVVAVDPIINNLALIDHSVRRAGNQDYVQYVTSPIR